MMKLFKNVQIAAIVVAVCAGIAVFVVHHARVTARPMPDFSNLPAYITTLNRSRDPEMMKIKREIADGPVDLAREKKIARADGIPLTLAQIQPPMPPLNQNASRLYTRLTAMEHSTQTGGVPKPGTTLPSYADPLTYRYSYTPAQIAAVRTYIATHPQLYHLVHEAANKPKCVFPLTFENDHGLTFVSLPYLATMRESANTLATASFLLAAKGKYSQAINVLALGYNVEAQAEPNLFLANAFGSMAVDGITTRGMQNILYSAGPNTQIDQAVIKAIVDTTAHYDLRKALQDETPSALMQMDVYSANPTNLDMPTGYIVYQPSELTPSDTRFTRNLVDAAEARYLSLILPLIDSANRQERVRLPIFQRYDQLQNRATSATTIDPVALLWAYNSDQDLTSLLNSVNETYAERSVVIAAAKSLAAKASTGRFLTALPGKFIDPFNNKPLGYRREGTKGFVVYSVGPDGTFNGGKPGQYTFSTDQVFFRYPGPPLKRVPADMLN